MKEDKIYTYTDLLELGISRNTLKDRFYKFPDKYGVKKYKKTIEVKGVNQEAFDAKWKHLVKTK